MDDVTKTRSAYESDAEAFTEKYLSGSTAADYGTAFLDAVDGSRLLDIGCGPGSDLDTFVDADFSVTGLDITRSFLGEAAARHENADVVQADMRYLPFELNSFDGIWASASFHHVPRADGIATLRECRRVLEPGGQLFVSVKRARTAPEKSRHFEYYDPAEFQTLLGDAGFTLSRFDADDHWVWGVATAEQSRVELEME